jgi:hypothetical protein
MWPIIEIVPANVINHPISFLKYFLNSTLIVLITRVISIAPVASICSNVRFTLRSWVSGNPSILNSLLPVHLV